MSGSPESLPTSAFDYELPPERIARFPAEHRDESRLLVLERNSGRIEHRIFRDIAALIPPGDALVLNDTRVFPARLMGRRVTGAEAEVLLLQPADGTGENGEWIALVRPGNKLKAGRRVEVAEDLTVDILEVLPNGNRMVRLDTPLPIAEALRRYGKIPLPPYIDRPPNARDSERYQTVYASEDGSVAAPTAGLHFTPELLQQLEAKGVEVIPILLHVGVGTFRPVEAEDPAEHIMHEERYAVTQDAADRINRVRLAGGRIWAVGTTVARTLETVTSAEGSVIPGSGATRLFIRPGYQFLAVDRLITNFHLPRSTLLMLVSAFGGHDLVMQAYRAAIAHEYRFYSYGDAMLILR